VILAPSSNVTTYFTAYLAYTTCTCTRVTVYIAYVSHLEVIELPQQHVEPLLTERGVLVDTGVLAAARTGRVIELVEFIAQLTQTVLVRSAHSLL